MPEERLDDMPPTRDVPYRQPSPIGLPASPPVGGERLLRALWELSTAGAFEVAWSDRTYYPGLADAKEYLQNLVVNAPSIPRESVAAPPVPPQDDALRSLVDDWTLEARIGHWDSCPAHPERVRNIGPCDPEKCGYDRKYEAFVAALAARAPHSPTEGAQS